MLMRLNCLLKNNTQEVQSVAHVAVIVLHYKNLSDTLECLHSLAKIDYPSFEIILVDNGSSDDLQIAHDVFTAMTIIRNEENRGFAEGCNRGLSHALLLGAQYMLLLNNDTVVDPAILSSFVKAAQDNPSAGAFGAKIFYYDDPITLSQAPYFHRSALALLLHPLSQRSFKPSLECVVSAVFSRASPSASLRASRRLRLFSRQFI
jgi:GT2 family glycosyltransferase